MSNRLNQEREKKLQPVRMEVAMGKLTDLGFEPVKIDDTALKFLYKKHLVILYPYSGWFSGKSVKAGRGLENLLKQLKSNLP